MSLARYSDDELAAELDRRESVGEGVSTLAILFDYTGDDEEVGLRILDGFIRNYVRGGYEGLRFREVTALDME